MDYEKEIEKFTQLIKENDNNPEYFFKRGFYYECLGMYENAIADFTSAININDKQYKYFNRRACNYFSLGLKNKGNEKEKQYKRLAINDWNEVWKLYPKHQILFNQKAYAEFEFGEYDEALETWKRENFTTTVSAYKKRAKCFLNAKMFKKAVDDFTKIIQIQTCNKEEKSYDERAEAYFEWAFSLKDSDTAAAKRYFKKALDDFKKYTERKCGAFVYRADLYKQKEMYKEAIDDYNKAISLNKNFYTEGCKERGDDTFLITYLYKNFHIECCIGRGEAYELWAKSIENTDKETSLIYYQKAKADKDFVRNYRGVKYYESTANDRYEHAENYTIRNRGQISKKSYQEAVECWNEVLILNPDYKIDYEKKAKAEGLIGDYENALADWKKCYRNEARAYVERGNLYMRNRLYYKAIDDYTMAVNLSKNNADYLCKRAFSYYCIGAIHKTKDEIIAREAYQKALADWNEVKKTVPGKLRDYFFEKAADQ